MIESELALLSFCMLYIVGGMWWFFTLIIMWRNTGERGVH